MKTTVFIATSLDGFIARENGDLDWLPGAEGDIETDEPVEDYGYSEFVGNVDYLVMGRNSFDKVLSFGKWYYQHPVIVLSSRPLDIPEGFTGNVEWKSCSPKELVKELEGRGARHLYIDGGKVIQHFLNAGLIREIIINTIPVLIGTGIPLFGPTTTDIKLRHMETRSYDNGFVLNRYDVLTDPTV